MPEPVAKPHLHNLQGMLAHRFEQPRYAVMLFSVRDPSLARTFLRTWLPRVARGDQPPASLQGPVLNFAFSWSGLAALLGGDPDLDIDQGKDLLEPFFTHQTPDDPGLAKELGLQGRSAPDGWWNGEFVNADIHLAVYGAFQDDQQATAAIDEIRSSASVLGLVDRQVQTFNNGAISGYRPEGGFLHFGYRDGVTSPNVDWEDAGGPGKTNFREFLLGYYRENDYPVSPKAPGAWRDFVRDGSFACLAWIEQDVPAFNRFLEQHAPQALGHAAAGHERDWIAAKLLGRWPDGSPLVRHPKAPPATPDVHDDSFGYAGDSRGRLCPLAAHIRVANMRDDPMTFANQVRFPNGPPRFIRRGFSFGPKTSSLVDDDVSRGVIGTFICARINEQFYTALRWIQKTGFGEGFFREPYRETMQDALFGNRGKPGAQTSFKIPLEQGGALDLSLADFIAYKGIAIFLLPSMTALERLARD